VSISSECGRAGDSICVVPDKGLVKDGRDVSISSECGRAGDLICVLPDDKD